MASLYAVDMERTFAVLPPHATRRRQCSRSPSTTRLFPLPGDNSASAPSRPSKLGCLRLSHRLECQPSRVRVVKTGACHSDVSMPPERTVGPPVGDGTVGPFSTSRAGRKKRREMLPLAREEGPLDVIFEDDHILVVNKPAGVKHEPVHRFTGGSLINRIAWYLDMEPFTVHRLDMFTSGVVCFAKSADVAKALHKQFQRSTDSVDARAQDLDRFQAQSTDEAEEAPVLPRSGPSGAVQGSSEGTYNRTEPTVRKRYLVLAVGTPPADHFTVDAALARDPNHKFARTVAEEGQRAVTHFTVLSHSTHSGVSLLEARPQTGRTHQIRVHLLHRGMPVLGDHIYGALPLEWDRLGDSFQPARDFLSSWATPEDFVSHRPPSFPRPTDAGPISYQALHAFELRVLHPVTGEKLSIRANLSQEFVNAARACRLSLQNEVML